MKLELKPAQGMPAADKEVIEEINVLLTKGMERIEDILLLAARKFTTLSERGQERMKAHPNPQVALLAERLERVAAHALHPRLAMTNGWASRKLEMFDYDTQSQVIEGRISVVLPNNDHLQKSFDDLSREETAQVFDSTTKPPAIRTVEEQSAWLAAKRLAAARLAKQERSTKLIVRKGRYRIQGSHFFPLKDRFTVRELETVLADLRRLQD